MMKSNIKVLILAILGFTLVSCGGNSSSTSSSSKSTTSESTTSSSSSSSSTSTSTSIEDPWFIGREKLDCGWYEMDLPKNKDNPVTLKTDYETSSWLKYSSVEEIPDNFRYIYANSCDDGPKYHKCSPNFYSYDSSNPTKYPGGIKFTKPGIGIQSMMFSHTGKKLEIRIGISQVNNASGQVEENKEPLHIYFFNSSGDVLGKEIVPVGKIETKTKEVQIYCTQAFVSSVCYFDIRMNAQPYKGSQNYNIGVGYISVKSWPQI